ncbi:MAG: DUF3556 domain-containing protein [Myxococcaceae bacterium]|nr:DUF3556 domain-containing protein [Myxococcaceae bacterium]
MGLLDPKPPPYEPLEWLKAPFDVRGRQSCEAWALDGYGSPLGIYGVYLAKVFLYVLGWAWFCSFGVGPLSQVAQWWLSPLAFQKAIAWSLLFEVCGLGCGSGPLTARYLPPFGGALYFARPGTTKLPLFGGRDTRSVLDAALYLALLVSLVRALISPVMGLAELWPVLVLVPLLGVLDKTLFLAARAEHYWVTLVCFALMPQWLAGAKAVQLALWFWAGVSKLNHHFPTVVCVMTSNAPLTRFGPLRRAMYRAYPHDLRPSRLATAMSHLGTALELGVPLTFLLTPLGVPPVLAMVLMLMLHGFITSNVPMGVPLEWNVMVVYGAFALFWAHPDVSLTAVAPWPVAVFLLVMLVAVPLAGNLWPHRISFLLAMRYYAGNWAWSVWLFEGESYRKLEKLKKTSPWVFDQLRLLYDEKTTHGLLSKVMSFRLMHLHGRVLPLLVPKAVERFESYTWCEGEVMAGLALGWNFGEGHLHHEQLLAAVQRQCGFQPGELRCIFVESQPLFGRTLAWRIVDAATGLVEKGELPVDELRTRQAWAAAAGPEGAGSA